MITIRGLRKTYSGQARPALPGLDLVSEPGTFLTLLGPSGCGKSTTLRCIAGLESPDGGEIEIGDTAVYSSSRRVNLPPARRRLGMVAQSYAVWPHMSVFENVEYPLKRRKVKGAERRARVRATLEEVDLLGLAERNPSQLSGGQQQRVALARALVCEPELLLLDEPLSNLDAKLRRELGSYLRNLQRELGLSVVFVTHDQDEALAMSDQIVLMREGEIIEQGAPESIYSSPRTVEGATFIGSANHVVATAAGHDRDTWSATTPYGAVRATDGHGWTARGVSAGDRVDLVMRPEGIWLAPLDEAAPGPRFNGLDALVESYEFRGMYWETVLRAVDGTTLTSRNPGPRWWHQGDAVKAWFSWDDTKIVQNLGLAAAPVASSEPDAPLVDAAMAEPAAV